MSDTNDGDDGDMLMPEPGPEPKKTPRAPRPAAAAATESKPDAAARNGGDEDLSAEIARAVHREPGEQVTCRRISKYHYRCNWWRALEMGTYDNPMMGGLLVTTNRICKSHFLRVTPAVSTPAAGNTPPAGGSIKAGRLSITVVPER
jgi:hypothetical protein